MTKPISDTPLAVMMQSVLGQLETGKVVIVFDATEESCSIVMKDELTVEKPARIVEE